MITNALKVWKLTDTSDAAIKCFLANYLPVQLFTSCGGFMLNPVISLALQLPLSMTRSKAERLQSAFYYTTCEWRFDPMSDHFPLWFLCEPPGPFPINHQVPMNFYSFFSPFNSSTVCVSACTHLKNKPHNFFILINSR